jgi:hypothetical protein
MRRVTGKPDGNRTSGVTPPVNEVAQSLELLLGRQGSLDSALGHEPNLSVASLPVCRRVIDDSVLRKVVLCEGRRAADDGNQSRADLVPPWAHQIEGAYRDQGAHQPMRGRQGKVGAFLDLRQCQRGVGVGERLQRPHPACQHGFTHTVIVFFFASAQVLYPGTRHPPLTAGTRWSGVGMP